MSNVDSDIDDNSREPLMSSSRDSREPAGNASSGSEIKNWSTSKKWMTICVLVFIAITVIMIPIVILVIIPAEVDNESNRLEMNVVATYLTNPTDEGFESKVDLQFSDNCILPSTAHMETAKMSWMGSGGGHLLKLHHINTIHVTVHTQHMKSYASIDNITAFTEFNKYIINADSFNWNMNGRADIRVLGIKVTTHIDKKLAMQGYNNFDVNPIISNVTTGSGSATALYATAIADLTSDANIVLNFGQNLNFYLKSAGVTIGIGTIANCSILMGTFSVVSTMKLFATTTNENDELMRVLGQFVSGVDTNVTMESFYLDTTVQWLRPALASMFMESILPGVDDVMVQQIDMYVSLRDLINVPFTVNLFNAINTDIVIHSLTCSIVFEGEHIATVDEPSLTVIVPAQQIVLSPEMTARVDFKHTQQMLDLLADGEGLLDLDCILAGHAEEFPVTINYVQDKTPAIIHSR